MLLFGEGQKKIVIFLILLNKKTYFYSKAMIKKFMTDICWGDLDYLLIDTPPGTSDEHLAVMENIKTSNYCNYSAILVTTPQVILEN